ncbi:TPA: tail fiber assembly protein [Escherichia coli]|nr:tail fiber assembly protein [Escherichia coli]
MVFIFRMLQIAMDEETSLLTVWKRYRVLLNRVDTSVSPDFEGQ